MSEACFRCEKPLGSNAAECWFCEWAERGRALREGLARDCEAARPALERAVRQSQEVLDAAFVAMMPKSGPVEPWLPDYSTAPLPRCAAPKCPLGVWNDTPMRVTASGLWVITGKPRPLSDKCWYHAHGKPLPCP